MFKTFKKLRLIYKLQNKNINASKLNDNLNKPKFFVPTDDVTVKMWHLKLCTLSYKIYMTIQYFNACTKFAVKILNVLRLYAPCLVKQYPVKYGFPFITKIYDNIHTSVIQCHARTKMVA